jgi:hypothetical protein
MNPIIASVVLLAVNTILFIYSLSPSMPTAMTVILITMAIILLTNIYKVGSDYVRLEEQARKNARLIAQQKKELQANQEKLKSILGDISRKEKGKIEEESAKVSQSKASREEQLKDAYWSKLEKTAGASAGSEAEGRLKELYAKRNEINGLIELSRIKYMKRQLDEESFKEIARDYQKTLIEIEGEIKKLGGETKEVKAEGG